MKPGLFYTAILKINKDRFSSIHMGFLRRQLRQNSTVVMSLTHEPGATVTHSLREPYKHVNINFLLLFYWAIKPTLRISKIEGIAYMHFIDCPPPYFKNTSLSIGENSILTIILIE